MNLISLVMTLFANLTIYVVIGTVGLMMLGGVFDLPLKFYSAVVIGLVVFVLEIFGKTLKQGVSAALSNIGDDVEEQTQTEELYSFLEEVLDVLLHTKGNTNKDETRRREVIDEISDILE
jgi:hypothetical protein